MKQIASKFVQWDVPELEKLKDSKVYKLRERLDNGGKLSRSEKNWLTRSQQYGHVAEYYAVDKTSLRSVLYGRIEDIIEVP